MSRVLRSLQYGVGTLVIYLAVSLLGWGLGDLAGYFGLAPRVAYAAEVLLLAGVAGYQGAIAPEGIRGGKDDRAKRVRRQTVVSAVLILAMYAALFFLPYADRRGIAVMPVGLAVRWIGALATAGGFALVMGSGIALGRMYSKHVTVQQEHRLVTTSIYRAIRHPRYLGVLLLAVGLTLLYRSWVGAALILPLIAILVQRIHDEERVLHDAFGPEWEAYARRSWRLIPYLY